MDIRRIIRKLVQEAYEGISGSALTFDDLPQKVKDYYRRNITISVAFVKKDGTVRHMAFRRSLTAYIRSDVEKTDAQANKLQNNNLMTAYDTNVFIKLKRESGDAALAAKGSFRNFKLDNVLAFLCGGELFDMRERNGVMERFGPEVHGALTKSMVSALKSDEQNADNGLEAEPVMEENSDAVRELSIHLPTDYANKLAQLLTDKSRYEDEDGEPLTFRAVEVRDGTSVITVYDHEGYKCGIYDPARLGKPDLDGLATKVYAEAYSAKHNANIYFPTFSAAVQHAKDTAEKKGFVVDEQDWFNQITTGPGKPAVGDTFSTAIGLTFNGKPANKTLNIQVYGMNNSFELTHYVA